MLFSVLTSSAVGLAGLLIAAPAPGNALATPGSGSELGHLAARRLAGVSPNHHALSRRKTNTHKKRQRCQQRPMSSSSTPAPQQTGTSNDYGVDVYVGGGNNNSGGTSNSDYNNPVTTPSNPTTTSAPATYTPPASTGGNHKLILAWPNSDEQYMSQFFTGKAGYYYTWSPDKAPGDTRNIRFCPMLWGDKTDANGNHYMIEHFVNTVVPGYADCVFAMNEVNQHDQANMDVATGIWMWNTYIYPLASQGYTLLGSPSTTSAPNGLDWMKQFLGSHDLLVFPTHICVHWYDVGFDNFKAYMENFHTNANYINLMVTEFACQNFNGGPQCTMDEIWAFVTQAVGWMDSTSWIDGYAPFGFMRDMQGVNDLDRLMNQDGTPTALGSYFINGN